jgi:hypothetical protein
MELLSSHLSDTLNFGNSVDPYSPGVFLMSEAACISCPGIRTMSPPKYA